MIGQRVENQMHILQTNEAAAPINTEAEMKEVREEQDDTPEKSSAAEDAPLVSGSLKPLPDSCTVQVLGQSQLAVVGYT